MRKLLKVAVIGLPNAGKSTFINSIISIGVCPVSKRVHTTRVNQKAIFLRDDTQVVFIDTPGLVNMKEIKTFAFNKDFVFGPEKSILLADLVAVVHDVSNAVSRNKIDPRIRGILEKFPQKNSILILNKIDAIKSKGLLLDTVKILSSGVVGGKPIYLKKPHSERVRAQEQHLSMDNVLKRAKEKLIKKHGFQYSEVEMSEQMKKMSHAAFSSDELKEGQHLVGWPKFNDVMMVSALNNDGIELVRDYFVTNASPANWMFPDDFLTDIKPSELAVRIIKSKLLDYVQHDIPYALKPTVEYWEQKSTGEFTIHAFIKCPDTRSIRSVLGTGGAIVKRITFETESILATLLNAPVSLSIKVMDPPDAKFVAKSN